MRIFLAIVLLIVVVGLALTVSQVSAFDFEADSGLSQSAQDSGHRGLGVFGKGADAFEPGINLIINIVLSFVGVLLLVLLIYGGVIWMTAGGNESQVEKATKLIMAAMIGILIVVSAYAISYFIISNFGSETLKN